MRHMKNPFVGRLRNTWSTTAKVLGTRVDQLNRCTDRSNSWIFCFYLWNCNVPNLLPPNYLNWFIATDALRFYCLLFYCGQLSPVSFVRIVEKAVKQKSIGRICHRNLRSMYTMPINYCHDTNWNDITRQLIINRDKNAVNWKSKL